MHINYLPEDILYMVFKQAAGMQADCLNNWKKAIPLLAVCYKWRVLAKPWVNYWAFIEAYDITEVGIENDNNNEMVVANHSDDDSNRSNLKWATNVDFLALHENPTMAKYMSIYTDDQVDFTLFIQHALELLQLGTYSWHNICGLNIYVVGSDSDVRVPDSSTAIKLAHLAAIFAKSFSQLSGLAIHGSFNMNNRLDTSMFAGRLVEMLSQKITILKASIPLVLGRSLVLEKIVDLAINLQSEAAQFLPQIYLATLSKLYIYNVPNRLAWNDFLGNPEPGKICFANLKSFTLIFDKVTSSISDLHTNQKTGVRIPDNLNFVFPKLIELRVENCINVFPAMHISNCTPSLKTLHLGTSFEAIEYVPKMNIKSLDKLSVAVDCKENCTEDSFYKVTNHLYGNVKTKSLAMLFILRLPFDIDLLRINWPNITDLGLGNYIDYFVLQQLLPRLPNLLSIEVWDVDFSKIHNIVSCEDGYIINILDKKPLKSKLRRFEYNCEFLEYHESFVVDALQNLLIRLPCLQEVYISPFYKNGVKNVLLQNKSAYPNLRIISEAPGI
ncbi:hypothetical protein GGI25_001660 [Coemansia spiralis]|uniref:F-box domain-containing protein n=1 Tax=Coemansia spiralis TaxID=417178 RepID=A0A9W8G9K5_9FUNG|nr:hypothetical protein GGI25_001660 [Coemansia spiralis]